MSDTGIISPQSQTGWSLNGANTIDGNETTFGLSTQGTTSYVYNFDGTDLEVGSTVTGVEVNFINNYYIIGAGNMAIEISLDGQSGTYSSTGDNQNLTTDNTTDYTYGGSSDTWGLDWTNFTDLSNLSVRVVVTAVAPAASTYSLVSEIKAKVYYEAAAGNGIMTLNSGKLELSSGKIQL